MKCLFCDSKVGGELRVKEVYECPSCGAYYVFNYLDGELDISHLIFELCRLLMKKDTGEIADEKLYEWVYGECSPIVTGARVISFGNSGFPAVMVSVKKTGTYSQ